MKLEDILDPEENRILQWRAKNLPDRSFSPDEYIYTRIKEDLRYIELPEDKKIVFLSKVKSFRESEKIDFDDEDTSLVLDIVYDVLKDINREFDSVLPQKK